MSIPINTAKGIFTNSYIAKYSDSVPAKTFLTSFFTPVIKASKYLSIEVMRNFEKISVDVLRGTTENRNEWTKSTEKNFEPPYHHEGFDNNALDTYDRVFGADPQVNGNTIASVAEEVAMKLVALKAKVERAIELQAAQVFETGVIAVSKGVDIVFGRKAASLKDNSAAPWSVVTSDIEGQLQAAGDFLRQEGKTALGEFNLIMSSSEFISLKKSNYFTTNANFNNVSLVDINMPQAQATGQVYQGRISAGSYIFNIWTYDATYQNASNVTTRIWPEKKIAVLPISGFDFKLGFAAVPGMFSDAQGNPNPGLVAGDFIVDDYVDNAKRTKNFRLQSAPLAIPVSIDQIYTMLVEV